MSEVRPIDANELVEKLVELRGDIKELDMKQACDVGYYAAMSRAIRIVKNEPTIDLDAATCASRMLERMTEE